MLLDRLIYKKTAFEAGGLLEDDTPKSKREAMYVPYGFQAPRRVDSRDLCLSASNQYKTPHCAGYTMAGYIEHYNWKTFHYPLQVSGDKIYEEAKRLDGNNRAGTTLHSAAKAAINLNFIKGIPQYVSYTDINQSQLSGISKKIMSVQFALHQYGVVLSGFRITDEWNWVNKKTGMIRDLGDTAVVRGGHAVLLCGYDTSGVYIQNSWGDEWGHYGFGILSWPQYLRQIVQSMIIKEVKS